MKTSRRIHSVAYHEAGHAVVALHFGLAAESHEVVINSRAQDGTLGHATHSNFMHFHPNDQQAAIRDSILIAYAGHEAEILAYQRGLCRAPTEGSNESDEEFAWELLQKSPPRNCSMIGDDAFEDRLERLRRKARKLVRQLWPQIEQVASVLLERRKVTYSDLKSGILPKEATP